jgi:hypothetical protein
MAWFRKVRAVPPRIPSNDDWIKIPFRYGEAMRVSLHTIGLREEVPIEIRHWIAQWLMNYNTRLSTYMRETYGEGIFPILDSITRDVMPDEPNVPPSESTSSLPPWERWEQEFEEDL